MLAYICTTNLVKNIIKTLIQSFQVEQNHCSTNLHTDLDLVDVATYLIIII